MSKRQLFTVLMLLLPALLVGLLEAGLRLSGAFAPEPLLTSVRNRGVEHFQLNPNIAWRYFDQREHAIPRAIPEKFLKIKPSGTFRIFCLGGSTTAGFPFEGPVPFPTQLRYLLQQQWPDHQFEVINAGISAVNSFTVLDLLPEILGAEPDLILIYMGHNEFYGAFGSGSSIAFSGNGSLMRLYLRLQHFRIVQMLKAAIHSLTPAANPATGEQRSLMAAMVSDQHIAFGSEKYNQTLANFRDNLDIILDLSRSHRIPVLLGNLVSNLRDMPPFTSDIAPLAGWPDANKKPAGSAIARLRAQADSSLDAKVHFRLATHLDASGDSVAAIGAYTRARDLDPVRFRASSDFNDAIQDAAAEASAYFVDVAGHFERHSRQGIVGADLMCDHLHPNPQGYYEMAAAFFEAIRQQDWLPVPSEPMPMPGKPAYATDLDWDIGLMKIYRMVHSWPFPEKPVTLATYPSHGDPMATPYARRYIEQKQTWARLHDELAKAYAARGKYDQAIEHYLAVALTYPGVADPYRQLASIARNRKNWTETESWLQQALPLSNDKGMVHYQIGIARWRQGALRPAIAAMSDALSYRDLDAAQQLNARYYMAGFFHELGDDDAAREALMQILKIKPGYPPAAALLRRLSK